MSLNILIGADAASAQLSVGLRETWRQADVRLFQLSAGAQAAQETLAALEPTAVLAGIGGNPAAKDELAGLLGTLKAAGVPPFGAGIDLESADTPVYFVKNGLRIGLYAVGEHSGAAATERSAGVNPLNPLELGDRVRDIRGNCDRLIVFFSGGWKGYAYPSPQVQKVCRKIAECGASLVLCQGGGVAGCYEKWDNATIVYGQGGFLSEEDTEGLLVCYEIGDYGTEKISFVPLTCKDGAADIPGDEKAAEMLETFERRSRRIRVQGFVEARYTTFAAENGESLLCRFADGPKPRPAGTLFGRRAVCRLTKERRDALYSALSCESERELLAEGLRNDAV